MAYAHFDSSKKDGSSKKPKGLGSAIEKVTEATGIKKVVEAGAAALNKDCGCKKRRDFLDNPNLMVNKVFFKGDKK
jgi:hypothetical protein